jgi:two-component system aerobic respiration control sensor histidine kinase ArcB
MQTLSNAWQPNIYLRTVLDLTEELIIILARDFTVLLLSNTLVRILDKEASECLNQDFRRLCAELDCKTLLSLLETPLWGETLFNKVDTIHNHTIEWNISYVIAENENDAIILIGKDKTDYQELLAINSELESRIAAVLQFQDNLRKSIDGTDVGLSHMAPYFAEIIAQTPGLLFWKDLHGVYQGCNDELAKFLSLPSTKFVIGKRDQDLFPPKYAQQLIKNDQEVIATQKSLVVEETVGQLDGTEIIYMSCKSPLHDKNGDIIGIIGTSANILSQKNLEKSLREAKRNTEGLYLKEFKSVSSLIEKLTGHKLKKASSIEKYVSGLYSYLENIISRMPGLVYWKDRDGVYLGCNENLARKMGLASRHDVVGKTDYEIFSENEADLLRKNDADTMDSGKAISIEESAIMGNNTKEYYITNKVPLYDESQTHVIGILGISLDITDLKNTEQELREAKELAERTTQAKSYFLATMSHELRTPLNGILGMAQVLMTQTPRTEQIEYVQAIEQSGKNLLILINDVLDFSRLEAGQIVLRSEKFGLKHLIEQVVTSMHCVINDKKIELKAKLDPKLPEFIQGDEGRLRQVLINLVGNAIKFTSQGQVVIAVNMLSSTARKIKIAFIIEDTGIGIPTDKLNVIFERFTQVESEYGRRFEGSGLGLAIVKNLVELMNGDVEVESELGKGSTFTCCIPFSLPEQGLSDLDSQSLFLETPLTFDVYILVVEDNPINQKVIHSMLTGLGCKVDMASNGKEAIKRFKKHEYDLIFMDLGLPDMDGLQVTKALLELQIKLERKPVPIVALTAHVMESDHKNCRNAGMSDIITKPIMRAQLVELLTKITNTAKLDQ